MKVLVIGGSGFIGSHVADGLSEARHEVTIFDRRPSPHLRSDQKMIIGDILDPCAVGEAVKGQAVVHHLAGIPHLDIGINQPVETVRQNVLGTVIALEASRNAGAQRFVYASSIYVYTEGGSFYRCSKQAAELYVEEYQRLYGLDYTILRFGTIYGSRADDHNSVRRYLKQALEERRITVSGTGDEMREYLHVRDAAQLCVQILADEFKNQHLVLTGHNAMRRSDLFKMIREIVGADVVIDQIPMLPSQVKAGIAAHYSYTPYAFRPKVARKLVTNLYLDMGQGLIECLEEIYQEKKRS